MARLTQAFFARDSVVVARALLGATLQSRVHGDTVKLRITEVEAYGGDDDPGSHAFRGRTERNAVMFGRGGHLYVYRSYGMHWCINVVTNKDGVAGAVLLRAGEIDEGVDIAMTRRNTRGVCQREIDLARGPGRLGQAMAISGDLNGIDLTTSDLVFIESRSRVPGNVACSPRTGVSGQGGIAELRFFMLNEPTVSPYRKSVARVRKDG